MPLETLPLAEQIVGDFLREHADLVALDANVAGRAPDDGSRRPWVRLTQIDAQNDPSSRVEHLVAFPLQLDCYAGKAAQEDFTGQLSAWRVALAARAVLKSMEGETAVAEGGSQSVVVTQVTFTGMIRIPDQDYEPAMERVVLDAVVRMHRA